MDSSRLQRLVYSCLICLMIAAPLMPLLPAPHAVYAESASQLDAREALLYRTQLTVANAAQRQRLFDMGLTLLELNADSATAIVTDADLETLARLRFQPQATDSVRVLADANRDAHNALVNSLQPLFDAEAAALKRRDAETGDISADALQPLRDALYALNPDQRSGLSEMLMADADGDGLSDTEESWWCTDPNNPNSDGDAEGYSDGEEVTALLDFTLPRSQRWVYGPPFGPPAAWPDWNGQDGDPNTNPCNDGDYDTIPDFAEVYVVGSRTPKESTDNDKFDDGQELFGTTYCPGAPTSCGYGNYPRIEYWNFIKAEMPNWVEPPGDNIFVAAFPVPEVSVVPGSWTVERVTTITTSEGQMTEQTNSYATSATRGQSSSVADTVTWNEWEEVSEAVETPLGRSNRFPDAPEDQCTPVGTLKCRTFGVGKIVGGHAISDGAGAIGGCGIGFVVGGPVGCVVGAGLGYVVGAVVDEWGNQVSDEGWNDLTGNKDQIQESGMYATYSSSNALASAYASSNTSVTINNNIDTQGIANSLDGVQYAINQQGELLARGLADVSYAISQPRFTETRTSGQSWGGSQTTTHEEYEEHSITNGEAFTTGQNWETAWAVDSSHAAELTFDFTITNSGTEYAREVTGLIFNIYLGDDDTPLVSYPAWELFPNGKLENLFPSDSLTFSTPDPIPLTLEQMKRIDLGERLTVVLEDFSYGADELFYEDAANGGLTVFIEDGVDDGDELVDSYVIPTWGSESVQDVLARAFPVDIDNEGNLNTLWTPEFNGTQAPMWNEHYLSDIAWWNVYLTQPDAGNTPLHELLADQGAAILFRFSGDSDRDGYNDRAELRYGTDMNDPADHPQPEMLLGYVSERAGDEVTVKLVLENRGTFDGYGIDAVMYAPDDTTTIGNNTVGGNGRVRPGSRVAVGSLISAPATSEWDGTAAPYGAGNYIGDTDRIYTFSTSTPGTVGSGSTLLNWSDDAGGSGTIDLGTTYHAPLPLEVSNGLEIGFDTGTIMAGDYFTMTAVTARDTFTYTVEMEPFTPPVIVASYSDPQGSHRLITPIELDSLESDFPQDAGELLLHDVGLSIVTDGIIEPSVPITTNFVINSPHPEPIEDAHLYLNFISDGELVAELPYTHTLEPGPTVLPVVWNTDQFTQTYDVDADNILLAFWTDAQNNIIDSAARPLSSFQEDPRATGALPSGDELWDFGDAEQGVVVQRTISLANTGYSALRTRLLDAPDLSIAGPISEAVGAADIASYVLTLDTKHLPSGPYQLTIPLRTSDISQPERTITIQGTILDGPSDTPPSAVLRPLDWSATIPGSHTQGEWVTFDHTLGADPQSLHPVYVYSEDGNTMWGVGQYATPFNQGTASYDMFGDGRDGDLTVSSGQTKTINTTRVNVTASGTSASPANSSGFAVGDLVLFHQSQKTSNVGRWEFNTIAAINSSTNWTLEKPLTYSYSNSSGRAQVVKVPQYQNVTVNSGGTLTAPAWNGSTGGILVYLSDGQSAIAGTVSVNGAGYRGGTWGDRGNRNRTGQQGESHGGTGAYCSTFECISDQPNGGGGGGGGKYAIASGPGGGGGYGTAGSPGASGGLQYGLGGLVYGNTTLSYLHFGSGGGGTFSNSHPANSADGGDGGGIVLMYSNQLTITGRIESHGAAGAQGTGGEGSGGGSGGSIRLTSTTMSIGASRVTALGGAGGPSSYHGVGGPGGKGRVRAEYCESFSGSTNPGASTQKLNCYIAEQVDSPPYNQTRLNLPESFSNGRTYNIQFGRRLTFSAAGEQSTNLRIPAGAVQSATLDALISEMSSGGLTVKLDIGEDGSWDWEWSGSASGAITRGSSDLVEAFNAEWIAQGAPTAGTIDVPIKVYFSKAGQVLLSNLEISQTGSSLRSVRLSAQPFDEVNLELDLGESSSDPMVIVVDVGDDGTIEWSNSAESTPSSLTTGDLSAAVNAFLDGQSGEVDVPIRIYTSSHIDLALTKIGTTLSEQSDLAITDPDLTISNPTPIDGEAVTITATLHNEGLLDAGPFTASFVATVPEWGDWYLGSTLIDDLAIGTAVDTSLIWDTTGYSGTGPIKVILDPYDRTSESVETNNEAELIVEVLPPLETPEISDVRVSNVRDSTFTVTWLTDRDIEGEVLYGTDPNDLSSIAVDARGASTKDETHFVTITGLQANTTYYFDVVSAGTTDDNSGQHHQLTTGPTLSPGAPETIYGQIFLQDGTTPAAGSLVYMVLNDANNTGSSGQAAPLVALVDSNGYWFTTLSNSRLANLSNYFTYSASGDHVALEVLGGSAGIACRTVDTADDSPTAPISLGDSCTQTITLSLANSWNLLSLPVAPVTPIHAQDVCDQVAAQGGNATNVARWLSGGWDTRPCDVPFNNFQLEVGEAYFVQSTASSTWAVEGIPLTAPVSISIVAGWNTFSVPHTQGYLAESLCSAMSAQGLSPLEIYRWQNGGWEGHNCGLPFLNFPIEVGRGYFVKSSSSGTFTP